VSIDKYIRYTKCDTHDRCYEEAIDSGCLPSCEVSQDGENTFFF